MKLPIEKVLVVSTWHVPKSLACSAYEEEPPSIAIAAAATGDYGWLVATVGELRSLPQGPDRQAVENLLRYAKDKGCRFVLFDQDGEELKQFPIFSW